MTTSKLRKRLPALLLTCGLAISPGTTLGAEPARKPSGHETAHTRHLQIAWETLGQPASLAHYTQSLQTLRAALPDDKELELLWHDLSQQPRTLTQLTQWYSEHPASPLLAQAIGNHHAARNQCQLAEPAYRRAQALAPRHPDPLLGLAFCAAQDQRPAEARQLLARAEAFPLDATQAGWIAALRQQLAAWPVETP